MSWKLLQIVTNLMDLMEELMQCYISYKMGVVLAYGQTETVWLRQKLEIEHCLAACKLCF